MSMKEGKGAKDIKSARKGMVWGLKFGLSDEWIGRSQ